MPYCHTYISDTVGIDSTLYDVRCWKYNEHIISLLELLLFIRRIVCCAFYEFNNICNHKYVQRKNCRTLPFDTRFRVRNTNTDIYNYIYMMSWENGNA